MINEILFILVLVSVIVFFGAGCFLAGYLSCKYNLLNKEKQADEADDEKPMVKNSDAVSREAVIKNIKG